MSELLSVEEEMSTEGKVSAGRRVQMESMTGFLRRDCGSTVPELVASSNSLPDVFTDPDMESRQRGLPVRSAKAWKSLLASERQKVLENLDTQQTDVNLPVNNSDCALTQRDNKRARVGTVTALNELQFLRRMGSSADGIRDSEGRQPGCSVTTHADIERMKDLYSLNTEQFRAFRLVAEHVTSVNDEPMHMYLGGMGGTGKSRVIDALSYFFEERGERDRFLILAPTGSAASLLGGSTYHSVLGMGRGRKTSSGTLGRVRDRLQSVDLIFVDEISMVSCCDMYRISSCLFVTTNDPSKAFEGVNIVFAEDFAQLELVMSPSLYNSLRQRESRSGLSIKDEECIIGKAL